MDKLFIDLELIAANNGETFEKLLERQKSSKPFTHN